MLVALGMTLVIATRGIDLSVGAVMAISGAVTLTIIDGSRQPGQRRHRPARDGRRGRAVRRCWGCGTASSSPSLKIQPIIATLVLMLAGRGVALLITGGFITTVVSPPLKYVASGYLTWAAVRLHHRRWSPIAVVASRRATYRPRRAHRGGRHQPRGQPAGRRPLARDRLRARTSLSATLAGVAGIIYSSNIMAADANAAGELIELYAILAVVLGGTSLLGGKFSIAGTVIGVLIIQTLHSTILFLGVPSAEAPVFFAVVVIIVVLIQSPRVHRIGRRRSCERPDPADRQSPARGREGRRMSSITAGDGGRPAIAARSPHVPEPALLADADVRGAGDLRRCCWSAPSSTSATSSRRGTCRRCCSTTPSC